MARCGPERGDGQHQRQHRYRQEPASEVRAEGLSKSIHSVRLLALDTTTAEMLRAHQARCEQLAGQFNGQATLAKVELSIW
jgi:hypothetical protein